jgi:hypothetical protein
MMKVGKENSDFFLFLPNLKARFCVILMYDYTSHGHSYTHKDK